MYKHILGHRAEPERLRAGNARLTALHVVDPSPWWAVVTTDSSSADTLAVIDAITRAPSAILRAADQARRHRWMRAQHDAAAVGSGSGRSDRGEGIRRGLIVLGGEAETGWRHGKARLRNVVCACVKCDVLIASHGVRRMPQLALESTGP